MELPIPDLASASAAPEANHLTRVLRFSVALQCVGLAWIGFSSGTTAGRGLARLAGTEVGEAVDVVMAIVLANVVWAVFLRPNPIWVWLVALWAAAQVFVSWLTIDGWLAGLSPVSSAARYLAPAVLAVLLASASHRKLTESRTDFLEGVLRVAIAMTFAGHGIKALMGHGPFVALITVSAERVGVRVGPAAAETLLWVIGAIDVVLAMLVVTRRWRFVAGYMAAWALITALSRVTQNGFTVTHAVLVRAPYYLVPLALFFAWPVRARARRRGLRTLG